MICIGIKKTGLRCTKIAKFGSFCGYHKIYFNDETSSIKETTPVPNDETSSIKETTPVPNDETSSIKETTPVPNDETSSIKDTTPVPNDETSSIKETTTVPNDETSSIKETTPVPNDETSSIKETTPVPNDETFGQIIINIIHQIISDPKLLEKYDIVEMCPKLSLSCNKKNGQGSANAATRHEACFSKLIEDNRFMFLEKKQLPIIDGLYYYYQPNGTQKSPDFNILKFKKGTIESSLDIDLKHSSSTKVVLNDGWFHENVLYILSYNKGNIIGLGQDIPTESEKKKMNEIQQIKKELNIKNNRIDNLLIYFRFANQYDCSKFTSQHQEQYLSSIKNFF